MDDVLIISQSYSGRDAIASAIAGDEELKPELWSNLVFTEARENLSMLHNEFLPFYVISSSWTNHLTQEQMASIFRRTGLAFVENNLHEQWTTPKNDDGYRADEIENWIALHRQRGQPLLVLDDLESGWSLQKSNLYKHGYAVLCDAWVGFIAEKLVEAQKKLRAQLTDRKSS